LTESVRLCSNRPRVSRATTDIAEGSRVFEVDLSEAARQDIARIAAASAIEALAQQNSRRPPVPRMAIRNEEVPALLGLGRSKFYELCNRDPTFLACSGEVLGVRVWSVEALSQWLRDRLKASRGERPVGSADDRSKPVAPAVDKTA
jgi:predicted DNA-binding transcriptional regulator AlpA